MNTKGSLLVALAAVVALQAFTAVPAGAQNQLIIPYIAILNSTQESLDPASNAFGVAFLTANRDTRMLCYDMSYGTLVGTETAAHFHGPAGPTVDAGILFNITAPGAVDPGPSPLGSPKTGCVGPLNGEEARTLNSGRLYINVHSDLFPAGEIRGQVLPMNLFTPRLRYNVPAMP